SGLALRSAVNLGSLLGPRMYTAGAMIDGVPPTYPSATGVATGGEARKAVDLRAVAGVDLVKIYTKITPQLLAAIADEPATLRLPGWSPADLQAFRLSRPRQDQFVREFRRAGGLIAAGSDAANQLLAPGLSLHEEMSLLVAAGLTPLEAITAATRKGAELLHA